MLSRVIGGWRLGVIQVYTSGFPLGVTATIRCRSSTGRIVRSSLPTTTGARRWMATSIPPRISYLNTTAFPAQLPYVLGNSTRYNPKARGFGERNENVSLAKTFASPSSFRLDFRAEAFNLFNRTVFSNPNTNLNSKRLRQVTGQSNAPRQMQLALKLYW